AAAPFAPPVASALGYVAHWSGGALVSSARLVELAPWLWFDVSPPSWWLFGAYYGSLAAAIAIRRLRVAASAAVLVSTGPIVVSFPALGRETVPPPPAGTLRVVWIDVGQGDSTLVMFPNGRALVVDAGGLPGSSFDVGDRVVAPALGAFGIRRLD